MGVGITGINGIIGSIRAIIGDLGSEYDLMEGGGASRGMFSLGYPLLSGTR